MPPPAIRELYSHDSQIFKLKQSLSESLSGQGRLFFEIDFIPAVVHQLGVDHRKARLAGSLGHHAGDQVAGQDGQDIIPALTILITFMFWGSRIWVTM